MIGPSMRTSRPSMRQDVGNARVNHPTPIRGGGVANQAIGRRGLPFEGNRPGAGKFTPPPTRGGPTSPGPIPIFRPSPVIGSMKKGGKVKKTGTYKLHKGEEVMPLSALAGRRK